MPWPISWLTLLKKDKTSILTAAFLIDFWTLCVTLLITQPCPQRLSLAGMNKAHCCPTTLESLSSTEWMVNVSTQVFFFFCRKEEKSLVLLNAPFYRVQMVSEWIGLISKWRQWWVIEVPRMWRQAQERGFILTEQSRIIDLNASVRAQCFHCK